MISQRLVRPVGSTLYKVFRDLFFEQVTFVLRFKGRKEVGYVKSTGRNLYRQDGEQIPRPPGEKLYGIFQEQRVEAQRNGKRADVNEFEEMGRHQAMKRLHEIAKSLHFKLNGKALESLKQGSEWCHASEDSLLRREGTMIKA